MGRAGRDCRNLALAVGGRRSEHNGWFNFLDHLRQCGDGCCGCGFLLLLAGKGKMTMAGIGVIELAIIICGGGLLVVAVVAGIYFWQQRER
jgi:hypothetical protein